MPHDAIEVVIVDDHPLLRQGLRAALERRDRIRVVGESGSAREALQMCRRLAPDVLVTDIAMAELDGLALLAEVGRWERAPRLVVLSMHDEFAAEAFRLGALGYVVKEDAAVEIADCVEAVVSGARYVSASVPGLADELEDAPSRASVSPLTDAEQRIVQLIAAHLTSREIAETLCVSRRTVDNHRANMCRKLGLKGPHALLRYALAAEKRGE